MPQRPLTALISRVVAGAPEWIRRDLSSKEQAIRTRAEDAIAAMIAAAIAEEAGGTAGQGD